MALAMVSVARPALAQVASVRPRLELGARVAAVAAPDYPRLSLNPVVTWNLDGRTALEASLEALGRNQEEPFGTRDSDLFVVQLKRSLSSSGPRRWFATVGAAFGRDRRSFPAVATPDGRMLQPAFVVKETTGGASIGGGFDRVIGDRVRLSAETSLILTNSEPILRTLVGASVPVGRYYRGPADANPKPAALRDVGSGMTVWVTTRDEREWKGEITNVSASGISILYPGGTTTLALTDIRLIEAPDSVIDGAARGAAFGLILGVPAFLAATSFDEGSGLAVLFGLAWSGVGAATGALGGALADSFHEGRRTVFGSNPRAEIRLVPAVARRGAGVGATIRW
jgi:hypothetical protein